MEGTTFADVVKLSRTIAVIFVFMYMLLGNDEQWEEMLLEEGRLDEMENSTVLGEIAQACVGAACGVSEALGDGEL